MMPFEEIEFTVKKFHELEMTIECSARPCISPETAVRITLTQNAQTHPKIKVSAIEYVSPWA